MTAERCRDIAHVSAAELRTAVPAETVEFFVAQLGLHEVARAGESVYLHTWDDYEMFTVKVTAAVCLEAGIHIETGPHKHAIQQTFFLYVWEPGGNRVELCNAGARLVLAPDWRPISWTLAERARGQAWGLQTIETFHTHGTPPSPAGRP